MSAELVVILIVGGWVAIGLTLSLVMGRRGHDAFAWLVLGTVFGPLAVALAIDARRHRYEDGVGRVLRRGTRMAGTIDVLVGSDGSPESYAAMNGVKKLFGDRLGRVTLLTVIPFDAPHESERLAIATLQRQALRAMDDRFGMEVLRGKPAYALREVAGTGGYQLIAVGSRGLGATKAALGSVASQLSRGSEVPVLMFGSATAAQPDAIRTAS